MKASSPKAGSKAQEKESPKETTKSPAGASGKASTGLPSATVLKRAPDVLSRRNSDGDIAILRLDNDEFFFNVDGIAAELWEMIDGKTSLDSIKKKLIEKHDPPAELFEKDVATFLEDLQKEKLIAAAR